MTDSADIIRLTSQCPECKGTGGFVAFEAIGMDGHFVSRKCLRCNGTGHEVRQFKRKKGAGK